MNGDLKEGQPHPMAKSALDWISANHNIQDLHLHREALASCAIEGNEMAEVCLETLRRLIENEPVSDRYLLGLAWYLRNSKERKEE